MAKLPSFQFYPGDWMKDPKLRRCSAGARGIWMDVLCLMFECDERGKLVTNGVTWTLQDTAEALSGETSANLASLNELHDKGVMPKDENGAFYSKRLISDELTRNQTKERVRKSRSRNADVTVVVTPMYEDEDEVKDLGSKKKKMTDCEDVYLAYPRKIGKGAALKAIDKAISRLLFGEANNPISNRDEAVVFLCQRSALFARAPAGNNGDFTPHPATWFNRSSYLDDESEWSKSGSGENGNGSNRAVETAAEAKRIIARLDHRATVGTV